MPGKLGIRNGNSFSCFRNAVLQWFVHSPHFIKQKELPKSCQVWRELGKLIRAVWSDSSSSHVVSGPKLDLNLLPDTAHDSHEYLIQLLDFLRQEEEQELKKPPAEEEKPLRKGRIANAEERNPRKGRNAVAEVKKNPRKVVRKGSTDAKVATPSSFITQVFQGEIKHSMRCLSCSSAWEVLESFLTLSLPLPDQEQVRLESLLDDFSREHVIDSCFCSKCKKNQQVSRRSEVVRLPQVLVLHLMRFTSFGTDKIRTRVEFPAEESLSYCGDRYRLQGVVNHLGDDISGGHYTSTIRLDDDTWCNFDDEIVTDVHAPKPCAQCYLLFYPRFS